MIGEWRRPPADGGGDDEWPDLSVRPGQFVQVFAGYLGCGPMDFFRRTTARRTLLAAALGLTGVAGATWAYSERHRPRPVQVTDERRDFPEAEQLSYLQVIAHPDDDLYFMNPGVQRA